MVLKIIKAGLNDEFNRLFHFQTVSILQMLVRIICNNYLDPKFEIVFMKKLLTLILLIFTLAIAANAQKKSNTEQYITRLSEEKFMYMHPDSLEKLKPFLDERLVYIHSSGSTESKADMLKNITDGKWMLTDVKVKTPKVRVFKSSTAILNAQGHFSVVGNGNKSEIDLLYTEVWAKYKEGWKLISRHASRIN